MARSATEVRDECHCLFPWRFGARLRREKVHVEVRPPSLHCAPLACPCAVLAAIPFALYMAINNPTKNTDSPRVLHPPTATSAKFLLRGNSRPGGRSDLPLEPKWLERSMSG